MRGGEWHVGDVDMNKIAAILDKLASALYRAGLPSGKLARAAAWCSARAWAARSPIAIDPQYQGTRKPRPT